MKDYLINSGLSNAQSVRFNTPLKTERDPSLNINGFVIDVKDDNITIGSVTMSIRHFEMCLKHMLEEVKKNYPEEFI